MKRVAKLFSLILCGGFLGSPVLSSLGARDSNGGDPNLTFLTEYVAWTATTMSDSTGTTSGHFANRADYERGLDAEYFTMIRYNMVLTAEELAHNLYVDEWRFF